MCLANASEKETYSALALEVKRLTWEEEIREKELDRALLSEKNLKSLLCRIEQIVYMSLDPAIKSAMIAGELRHSPRPLHVFPNS